MLEELKKEGLFLANGNFNSSYPKKFKNTITPDRQAWYDSLIGDSLSEKVYLLQNGITKKPVCPVCGKEVKFISPREGYRDYCSLTCRAIGTKETIKNTNLERYGTISPAQNKSIQDKMKQTTLERYGVENIFQRKDIIQEAIFSKHGVKSMMQLPEVRERLRLKNQELYGKDSSLSSPDVREKIYATNLKKHGSKHVIQRTDVCEKRNENNKHSAWLRHTSNSHYEGKVKFLPSFSEYKGVVDETGKVVFYNWECLLCGKVFEDYILSKKVPRCPHCQAPKIQGIMEGQLVTWIKSIIPHEEIILNSRRIIAPLEIDIYLPKYKLAIEFDEVYWHSELTSKGKRDATYHIGKTKSCEELGITLLHIWDYEWWNSSDIVKSIILSKLGFYSTKVGARKCSIKEVFPSLAKEFYNENHIQGYAPSSLTYGLYYDDTLVSCLGIAKNRFKLGTYEIVRYASRLGYSVQGGLTKLWNYVQSIIPKPFTLLSYVDLRYFHGKSNESLGLNYSHTNRPAYHYTKDYKTLENRMGYQKKNILAKGMLFDDNLSEWENMQLNGYDRVWDCGTSVFTKEFF